MASFIFDEILTECLFYGLQVHGSSLFQHKPVCSVVGILYLAFQDRFPDHIFQISYLPRRPDSEVCRAGL